MGFDVEADGEAAEGWEGVVDADALVVGLFDFLGVDAHVAVEVVAQGHGGRPVLVVDVVLEGEAYGPGAVLDVAAGLQVDGFHTVGIGAIEEVGSDARRPSAGIAVHEVGLCGVGGVEVEVVGANLYLWKG